MKQVNVLIADDEEDILEILTFLVESSIECTIHCASDGQEAIALLNQHEIDLIICDYNMPNKNGGDVYKHILNSNSPCKYVMFSSDLPTKYEVFKDRSSFFGFIEKPDLTQGIVTIIEKFKAENILIKPSNIHDYTPIGIKLLLCLSIMPSDIYIKLAEKKYVKVFEKNDLCEETDYVKFTNNGIVKLYATNVSRAQIVDLIEGRIKNISEKATLENKLDSASQIHNIIVSSLKEYGVEPSFVPLIEKNFQRTLEICKTNKSLNALMDKLLKNEESYLTKHSFLLAAVNIALATKMEWVSDLTGQKIIISALFHDIFLPISISNEVLLLKENKNCAEFLSHSQKASELLDQIPGIPADTSRIILEHHEVGEDFGFPRKMATSKTTPLSQLFIFSHYLVDIILEMHEKGSISADAVYQKMESISKKTPKNAKFFSTLKDSGLFK